MIAAHLYAQMGGSMLGTRPGRADRTSSSTARVRRRPRVMIIGAGPAGLALACLLQGEGIACTVLEHRSRTEIETRTRAGLLEHRSVEMLRRHGLAERLLAEGARHDSCEFR